MTELLPVINPYHKAVMTVNSSVFFKDLWFHPYLGLLQCRRPGFNPWVGKISWRRKWQPTAEFLPGKSHGQRNLVGYSPWGHKESDRTERLHFHFHSLRASVLGSFSGHRIRWLGWNSLKSVVAPSVRPWSWPWGICRTRTADADQLPGHKKQGAGHARVTGLWAPEPPTAPGRGDRTVQAPLGQV